ncbi:MAG TPA: G1 family glutamic endopeptidase [Acidimicrobiales bacterium]|nr:G1 family glutamic endopeptidase [Acidimicrobiales bacterium]
MRTKVVLVAGLAIALVVSVGLPRADASARVHSVNNVVRVATAKANAPEYSSNWSGYAVPARPNEPISAVNGSWIVPAIRNAPPGFSSSWIGVGGYRSNDLIQTGTASSGRLEGNYAWYEILPANETRVTGCTGDPACGVREGDRMAATVEYVGGGAWVVALTNWGKSYAAPRWTWSTRVAYASSMSSAEWVFEAPRVAATPLLPVQTIPAKADQAKFLAGADFRTNGTWRPLAQAQPSRMIMVDPVTGLLRTATPSMLGGDGHFAVCGYRTSCKNF